MSGNTNLERKIVVYDKHDAGVSIPLSRLLTTGFREHHNINNKKRSDVDGEQGNIRKGCKKCALTNYLINYTTSG